LLAKGLAEARRQATAARLLLLGAFAICGVTLALALTSSDRSTLFLSVSEWLKEDTADRVDQRLQLAATSALGDRGGTVIVMDPQTGRIRAVVNSKLAFEEAFRPGSTIKPFTALAALRSGILEEGSEALCRE
jgi:membrane carboxypeptidase/penicillin-binding protein